MEREIIQKARQTNLVDYLLSRGEELKKVGNRWEHKKHDSLIIKNNMFYWNSKQEKGNSLDFLILFYGYDFKTAIEELTKHQFTDFERTEEQKEFKINYNNNVKRLIAYLVKKRFIDYEIVKELLHKKIISQDEKGNIIFKIYDNQNNVVGAELCGTGDQRFKGIAEGSQYGYGFNFYIPTNNINKYIFFFESPIDLISFYELKKTKIINSVFVSLAGLKENIFDNMLKINAVSSSNAFLCVDNDLAGKEFINAVRIKYEGIKTYLPPNDYKDWNEYLIKTKIENKEG